MKHFYDEDIEKKLSELDSKAREFGNCMVGNLFKDAAAIIRQQMNEIEFASESGGHI